MNNLSQKTTRRDAVDLPPAAGEIEIDPGSLAQAPRRVAEKNAVKSLREIHAQQREFSSGVAEAQAKLDVLRDLAIELQTQYGMMLSERDVLVRHIAAAESELAVSRKRMDELDGCIRYNWTRQPMQEEIEEYQRREFMAQRIPQWISDWKSPLAVVNEKIAFFEKLHGVGADHP